jgi:hypothetical protein
MASLISLEVVLGAYAASLRLFQGKQLTKLAAKKGMQRKHYFWLIPESDASLRQRLLKEQAKRWADGIADIMVTKHGEIRIGFGDIPFRPLHAVRPQDKWRAE